MRSGGLIQYGECRFDEKNRIIVLSPNFQYDSVILEYVSAPEKDADYNIQTCFQEAVISFIKWKMKQGAREEFYAAVIEGRSQLPGKKVTAQTINEVIRSTGGMYLKA